MNREQNIYEITLFKCDLGDAYYTEETDIFCRLSEADVETLVNLNTHTIKIGNKLHFFSSIVNDWQCEFDLNSRTLKKCTNMYILEKYRNFLSKPSFEKWDTKSTLASKLLGDKTIWRLEIHSPQSKIEEFLTKHEENIRYGANSRLSRHLIKLHSKGRISKVKDYSTNTYYLMFHSTSNIYFVPLTTSGDSFIKQNYNIRRFDINVIIFHNFLFYLTSYCHHIRIFNLTNTNFVGKIKTNITGKRCKKHLTMIQRISGLLFIGVYAEKEIPYEICSIIDEYIDTFIWKYEMVIFNRITQFADSGHDEIPTCFKLNKIISHLTYLCLT